MDRMALHMHGLCMVCKNFKDASGSADYTVAGDWSPDCSLLLTISKSAIALAYLRAEKCERTWKDLRLCQERPQPP